MHFGFGRATLQYGCARQEVLQLDCCCSLLGVGRRFSSWPMQFAGGKPGVALVQFGRLMVAVKKNIVVWSPLFLG